MKNKILLSFDIEEFDLPLEYDQPIKEKEMFEISKQGLLNILTLINKHNLRATFFTTANFAEKYPKLIKTISNEHEIASHGVSHSSISEQDLKKSRLILEKITKKQVIGFRAPRLKKINRKQISQAGYKYDSSLNPTYIPKRYNNFLEKRTPHYSDNLLIIPTSVTPIIRFPLFWMSFKNLPLTFIKPLSNITLKKDNHLTLYFHPWEFTNIFNFNIPFYIKKHSGKPMLNKLENYLLWLKTRAEFITFKDFLLSNSTTTQLKQEPLQ